MELLEVSQKYHFWRVVSGYETDFVLDENTREHGLSPFWQGVTGEYVCRVAEVISAYKEQNVTMKQFDVEVTNTSGNVAITFLPVTHRIIIP